MMFFGLCSRLTPHSPSGTGGVEKNHPYRALMASALSLCLIIAALALPAAAQQSTGAIVGTVTDPSGAAIQGATVTAKDVDRGTAVTAKTNEAGEFSLPLLPIGNYEVKAEKDGFASASHAAFNLVLNQTARLNFQLKVGQKTEIVEVSAAAPVLQTDTTLLGTLVDAKTAETLPLATHNTNQLTLITTPGVITPNPFGFQATQNTFGTGRPYVNGAREQENNFVLDGMDNNQPDNNDVGYVPAPDAIQEFNLITGNAPADFGNYLGGVVNVSIKSGTNQYHGSAYEYVRNTALDANSWQSNTACNSAGLCGKDANGHEIQPRSAVHYNDFGFTFGGPIAKNKLFFFADYSESIFHSGAPASLQAIPLAERAGNFSATCKTGFTGGLCNDKDPKTHARVNQLYDPASNANPLLRTPFLNNQIPVGRFNSAALAIINSTLYPSGPIQNGIATSISDTYQGDVKIDYVPTDKDHIMGRWSQQYVSSPTNNSIQLLGDFARTFPLKNFVTDWTHTLGPNLLNDARIGFQYFPVTENVTNPTGQNLPAVFGIAGATSTLLPKISVNGEGGVGDIGNADLVETFHDTTLQFEDSITWTHGKQSIHAGFEAFHYIMNDLYPGNAGLAGTINFNGQFTGNTGTSGGSAIADFLLGDPLNVGLGNAGVANKYLRNSLYGIFGADTWHLRDNLTLNLGLRYELITARTTKNGQDVNFNLVSGVPTIGVGYNTYKGIDNFQPRLGLAWQPKWGGEWTKNTVIRAAYGISTFMEANGVNNLPYQNPPGVEARTANYIGLAQPGSTLDQGFSGFFGACTAANLQAFAPICLASNTLHLTNPNLMPAVDQQWNLSIQRQLGQRTSIQIGYVGNKIDHMSDIFIFNQNQIVGGAVVPGPFAQPLLNCNSAGSPNLCPLDPNGNHLVPTIRFNDSSGIQRYNALQVTLSQRAWKGLQYQANYTWSKCLTNSLGYFGPFGDEEAPGGSVSQTGFGFFFQNAYDPRADYGRCISDVASLFNGYLVYDLPFGKGRQFGGNASPVVNGFIGGWSLASGFTFHTGFAIDPSGPDSSGTGSANPRPNCVAGVSQSGSGATIFDPVADIVFKQFLNPAAVSAAAPGTFGTCPEGAFRGPGLRTEDLSLQKSFPITERVNLQLMTQFINLTNTPIFGAPTAGCGNVCSGGNVSSFGRITASNPGRQIQFGMKVNF